MKGKHALHQSANDWAQCECRKLFSDSKTKTAIQKLGEHIHGKHFYK